MRRLLRAFLGTRSDDWTALLLRIPLGLIFMAHGAQKVFGWFGGRGLKATADGFQQMGIPRPWTYLDAFWELLGGLAVFTGFFTRVASLGVATIMGVAIAKVHARNGFFMNWGNEPGKGHGVEANLALGAMALSLAAKGGGALSVDGRLAPAEEEVLLEVIEVEETVPAEGRQAE